MKINGFDTEEEYGVKEWTVAPAHLELTNADTAWPSGFDAPILFDASPGLKTYKATMMVKAKERKEMWSMASRFIGALMKPCEIEFDDFDTKFYGVIKDTNHTENVLRRWHKLEVNLIGYEYDDEETVRFSGKTQMVIVNYGTIRCPCSVEIMPLEEIPKMTLFGMTANRYTGKDNGIVFRDLKQGETAIINRKTGKMTYGGANAASKIDLYQMPSLVAGENEIICDSSAVEIKISYNPMYA